MSSTWKAALGIFLVFLFGCISGGLSTSLFYRHEILLLQRDPAEAATILEKRFTHHLDLDPSQHRQIHDILLDYLQQRKKLQSRLQPDLQQLNLQMIGQIRAVLHPDQVQGFRDNVTEFRHRLAKAAFRPPEMEGAETNAAPTNAPPIQ